ncbi:hypothetical protein [Bradyrhizobium elkanii]|uniref:hypothetical protein n=1 Tax=Bradyrhizobium elkanii TaxID=29448 RepID=UPI002169179F|nr:hypothetical protein [Bradyrhizobium elkanii]MCS3521813.1 hypothetical protein [Bradyrhizobium elkanii]MCS4069468.1 hypothetical protein [Bradyrhizobium elkanii]MCS4076098.1 hypothetical protein [Bradyrhizobium elkanii]MCW2125330.1 hypothetical protein [Bradyrhizobium elkanii]MCW2172077.1 hypothetical protein [Bradyrhizobium elkanii]
MTPLWVTVSPTATLKTGSPATVTLRVCVKPSVKLMPVPSPSFRTLVTAPRLTLAEIDTLVPVPLTVVLPV